MIRALLFVALAAGATAYAYWIYLRVDLAVPAARRLAALRAIALVTVLALLFDLRLPFGRLGDVPTDWVLLDASLSMSAAAPAGASPWTAAAARARALESDGWNVVAFGGDPVRTTWGPDAAPSEPATRLAPALERAAEAGARRVVVLSDFRIEDGVAVRSTLESLPLDVRFESFPDSAPNAGITRFEVPDFVQPDRPVTAEIEVHGGGAGDSLTVQILAEGEPVASVRVPAPSPGLTSRASVEVAPPTSGDRTRFSATVSVEGDVYPDDDQAVDYAAVGREEGGLVLVSFVPDWEPRYLLPALRESTGLGAVGYLRAGPNRFVLAGRALERGPTADSAAVRRAVEDAALVVLHGLGDESDEWARALVTRPGRKLVLVRDAAGARLAGVGPGSAIAGEWYVSAEVPPSPIAGALAGLELQGLPPLRELTVVADSGAFAPLRAQLRGAGVPEAALLLDERSDGRVAVVVASGFWRWAARDSGRDAYRGLWSGVAGWVLADRLASAGEPRPASWVVDRGEPVTWTLVGASSDVRVVVESAGVTVVDTVLVGGGSPSTGVLSPGPYTYSIRSADGDSLGAGRFDVAGTTREMLPSPEVPALPSRPAGEEGESGRGRPLRTLPWPYLLVIGLICGEWVGRRRSGLR